MRTVIVATYHVSLSLLIYYNLFVLQAWPQKAPNEKAVGLFESLDNKVYLTALSEIRRARVNRIRMCQSLVKRDTCVPK